MGSADSRIWRGLLLVVFAIGLGLVALAWQAQRRADSLLVLESVKHDSVLKQIDRVRVLRTSQELVEDRPVPNDEIIAPIRASLQSLSIDPNVLTDLTSLPAEMIPDSPYRRQRVTLTLSPLKTAELARFLNAWHRNQPLWIVSDLSLDRIRPRSNTGTDIGTHDRFSIHITLENIHLAGSSGIAGTDQ